jgi:hypothetical protein
MTTRTSAFAPLSTILIAVFLNAALNVPDASATDVAFTNFQGAWAAASTYNPGTVVTYGGVSYICLVENTHLAPTTHPHYWAALGPSNSLVGSNSVSYTSGTTGASCSEGTLLLSAGNVIPAGFLPADGRLIPILMNTALYSLLGTTFGGDGASNFGLPDLRALAPNNTIYLICINGIYP